MEFREPKLPGFNSKLVRLKVRVFMMCCPGNEFQFQTGAIKSSAKHPPAPVKGLRFNSKLVRLKDMLINAEVFRCRLFQFQTGAIKSGYFLISVT